MSLDVPSLAVSAVRVRVVVNRWAVVLLPGEGF